MPPRDRTPPREPPLHRRRPDPLLLHPLRNPYHPPPSTSTPLHPSSTAPPTTTTPSATPMASGSRILTATENFITVLDALKLNMLSKDALHPLLAELIQSVNEVTTHDFEGRGKIISWLIRLNGMRAQEELGEGEARELGFEMEGAYRGFKGTLT